MMKMEIDSNKKKKIVNFKVENFSRKHYDDLLRRIKPISITTASFSSFIYLLCCHSAHVNIVKRKKGSSDERNKINSH